MCIIPLVLISVLIFGIKPTICIFLVLCVIEALT
jgi:hypothetical protein